MHLGAECHLIIVGFFDDCFEVFLGFRLLTEVFVEFAKDKLQTGAEIPFGFVVKRITDVIYSFLHIAVGGGEVVFGFCGVEEHGEFLLVLLFVHVANGFQQFIGAGIVTLPHLGTGKQYLRFVADVRLRVGVRDVVQHTLRLHVVLLVEIGFGHQEISVVNGFDVFLALDHH